ncbi:hypothetical protein [Streptomyces sp. HSG2]|uniref:hypothetical protein n=1 Tax=Streptomyces sp. HSG2 TaxID=2797167 RepID=UPI001F5B617E|nr:hypothetical protein [Streptomyces sp. HSG2]
MCTPDPPCPQTGVLTLGSEVVRVVCGAGAGAVGDGGGSLVGGGVAEGSGAADVTASTGVGVGEVTAGAGGVVGGGDEGSSGADWATGAVGRVEPTTKWMVAMTAVTLAAVQESQMIR